jgi:hypothetical protein
MFIFLIHLADNPSPEEPEDSSSESSGTPDAPEPSDSEAVSPAHVPAPESSGEQKASGSPDSGVVSPANVPILSTYKPLPVPPKPTRNHWMLIFPMLVLILALAAAGIWMMRKPVFEPTGNLALLAARATEAAMAELAIQTSDSDEAALYIRNHFGWRVLVPTISDAALKGISLVEIASEVRVPAFVFEDSDASPFLVYVWNYSFMDRHQNRLLALSPMVLSGLEQANSFTVEQGQAGEEIVIWRSRDDIFLAVTSNPAEILVSRIKT